jgi:hypothetical protein
MGGLVECRMSGHLAVLAVQQSRKSSALFARLTISGSRIHAFELVASPSQNFFTGQSPTQTVFPLQEKCIVISFHSDDVYLSRYLVFKPVPYFHHGANSFLTRLGNLAR